jgi:hypothetical protein
VGLRADIQGRLKTLKEERAKVELRLNDYDSNDEKFNVTLEKVMTLAHKAKLIYNIKVRSPQKNSVF